MLFINYALIFMIVISAVAYFYFKTKQFRSELPIRKKWYKAKAGVALSIFIIVFGLNIFVIYSDAVGFVIAIAFVALGLWMATNQYKRVRHEGKFVVEEYELNKI